MSDTTPAPAVEPAAPVEEPVAETPTPPAAVDVIDASTPREVVATPTPETGVNVGFGADPANHQAYPTAVGHSIDEAGNLTIDLGNGDVAVWPAGTFNDVTGA